MKKITLFLLTLIISCSAWGAQPAQLYLKPNDNWKKDGARFAAYFFDNGETWVSMNKIDDNLYVVDVPTNKSYPKVIFCRMNPSTTTNNWNNKWNQTGDLTIPTDGKNTFTIPSGSWDGATTAWSKTTPTVKFNSPSTNFSVGETFTPSVTQTYIYNPQYTYKVNTNNTDTTFTGGYTFKDKGPFKFTVEAKSGTNTSVLATATHTITIEPIVAFTNTQTTYVVGDKFKPTHSYSKVIQPTYTYQLDGLDIEMPNDGYEFTKAGNFTFQVNLRHNNQGNILATDRYTVVVEEPSQPHVWFNNDANTEYSVGSKFTPQVESENIAMPTYTYKVNGNAVTIPDGGYLFEDQGTFEFTVEARSNGEGDVLKTATHTVTIEATVNLTGKTDYNIGETYNPIVTSTGILHPTYSYSVKFENNTTDIEENQYIFQDRGTYLFTVNALYNGKTIVSNTQKITIAPTVEITNASEVYYVGDTFTPKPSSTSILNPTYSYKLNGEEIDLENGYTFTKEDNYTFTIEVKNNGEGNVLASEKYTITITNPTVVYLKPNLWTSDNARFAAYFFSSGTIWVDMKDENGDGIYECIVPQGQTKVIFCRMNPTDKTNDWSNKWNQTGDLTYNNTDNLFTFDDETWDGQTSGWSTYTPSKLYISGDLENEIEVKEGAASTTQTGAFPAGTYEVVVNDGTRYWQNATSITIEETVPTIDFSVDATTKEITVTPKNTFAEPSNLIIDTEYGNLTYQFSMPSDQWYWISLPFNVNIDQITTSTGNGAKDLVITYYDAKERATTGKGGWKNATEQGLTTLIANQGYVIGFYTDENTLFPANGVTVNFPSAATTNDVNSSAKNTLTSTGGNTQNDNWYIIGTGLYHQGSLSNINYVAMPDNDGDYTYHYISTPIEDFEQLKSFAPFTAFFVQYGGDYSATKETTQSAALAPVARAKAQQQEQIYLINMNEAHTVVILNAEGSEGYTAGEDFLEMNASNHSDLIYSFDGSDALAFNHRALEAQSIALGGYVATAGEQTVSLKGYNANVESVTLVDNVTGETADLLAGDYTFNAEVGSLDGRFTVVFGAPKAGDTTVDCYNSTANQLIAYGSANACTVSGLTTGEAVVVYNAMGQLVFATIADSETITLPSLTTGNYLILHNGTTNKVLLK